MILRASCLDSVFHHPGLSLTIDTVLNSFTPMAEETQSPHISFIVPVYNEEFNITGVFRTFSP